MTAFSAGLVLLLLVASAAAEERPLVDKSGWLVHRELLPHSQDSSKRVEVFWTRPAGEGPYPVLLLIHGHQDRLRNGGEAYVKTGYGKSDGPQDYCGQFTQDAALVALDFLWKQPFVDPKRVAVYGYQEGEGTRAALGRP